MSDESPKACVRCHGKHVALVELWTAAKVHPPEMYRREGKTYVIPNDDSAYAGDFATTDRWSFDCLDCGYVWTARGIDVTFA